MLRDLCAWRAGLQPARKCCSDVSRGGGSLELVDRHHDSLGIHIRLTHRSPDRLVGALRAA
jgi:hypothetical protein